MKSQKQALCAVLLLMTTACHTQGGGGYFSPAANLSAVPAAMNECENGQCEKGGGGLWMFRGPQGSAHWINGATATLSVERFDHGGVIIHRTDSQGSSSAGLTAVYKGQWQGDQVSGNVTWTWPNGRQYSGNWSATIAQNPQLAQSQWQAKQAQWNQAQAQKQAAQQAQQPQMTPQQAQGQDMMMMGIAGAMMGGMGGGGDSSYAEQQRESKATEDRNNFYNMQRAGMVSDR